MDALGSHVQRLAAEALGKPLAPDEEVLSRFCSSETPSALFIFESDDQLVMSETLTGSSAVLALVKQNAINLDLPLHTQLFPIAVPGGESAESLHQIVHHVLAPFFEASAANIATASANIASTRQKIAELELSFHNLQFHTEIQLVQLQEPPLPAPGEEANLNALQNIVNDWKKNIRNVVRVTRDPANGTASEEVLFWRSMENALVHIEQQLDQPQVQQTIHLLEQGKRFHATMSFPADTGLPETLDLVQKYNVLLRELPIDELLLSKNLKSVENALDAVFSHFSKKLRPSAYPVWRAIALVEAISGDLARVLREITPKVLLLSKAEFATYFSTAQALFLQWEDLQREFTNLARDVIRKRGEKFIPVRITLKFAGLKDRLDYIQGFRVKHDNLVESFTSLSRHSMVQLQSLYAQMAESDVLDTTPEGIAQWNVFESKYNALAAVMEAEAAKVLKSQLGEAQSATEMFRIFGAFQSLLKRPAIRGAIHEYQARLLEVVKSEIAALQQRVSKRYNQSFAFRTATFFDVPSVSGLIIWLLQIRDRLDKLLEKLSNVLGPDWQTHVEGQQLQAECTEFRRKIDTQPVIDGWLKNLASRKLGDSVFGTKNERLLVKYDAETGQLFKEFNALQAMGIRVPHTFTTLAQNSRTCYPLAVRLIEDLKLIYSCFERLGPHTALVSPQLNHALRTLKQGVNLSWSTLRYDPVFVANLNSAVASLNSRTNAALAALRQTEQLLEELEKCAFSKSELHELVQKIQRVGIAPADEIAARLGARCITQLRVGSDSHLHTLTLANQMIIVSPPLSASKTALFETISQALAQIDMVPIVQEVWAHVRGLIAEIDQFYNDAEVYLATWLRFQSLWDLKPDRVYAQLDGLADWQQLVSELTLSRENIETTRSFGPIRIDSRSIHAHVSTKYDQWQNQVVEEFAKAVNDHNGRFMGSLRTMRQSHEAIAFHTGSSELLVGFLKTLELDEANLREELRKLRECQTLLSSQRYQFPRGWVFVDQMASELDALIAVHQQRCAELETVQPRLRDETKTNIARIRGKLTTLVEHWQASKPVSGSVKPEDAIFAIARFETEIEAHIKAANLLEQISEYLGVEFVLKVPLDVRAEIKDFMSTWNAVAAVWESLRTLEERKWSEVQTKQVRGSLSELLETTQGMPSRVRQYAAFQHVQGVVRDRVKSLGVLSSLCSPAMQGRHWDALGVRAQTLGDVWRMDLLANKARVEQVVQTAEGEYAIEQTMTELSDFWSKFNVVLTPTKLVKNWDEIFAKIEEHSNTLSAMSGSLYYKPFAQPAQEWATRIQKMYLLFDVWVQVQQQWLYLEGVFSAPDVRNVLPSETARFTSVNREFQVILKMVQKTPGVLEVAALPDIDSSMDRLHNQLSKLQKALGDYFERQRQDFGRFYFVGDDDLLEMVGEFSERVGRHLSKMFAGISGLEYLDGNVVGVYSIEGEVVQIEPVSAKGTVSKVLRATEVAVVQSLKSKTVSALETLDFDALFEWLRDQPMQVSLLALRINYTRNGRPDAAAIESLAEKTLEDLPALVRARLEAAITELVHQQTGACLEYHLDGDKLVVRSDAFECLYGWEYQGAPQQLVQTPLVDNLFLSMTQALAHGFGGSPFGPAGTGKTEGVKALGQALGMFVVVFCCDESFDFKAITRLLAGICQTGAWACFDEFNRLESSTMSSVSVHVAEIEHALVNKKPVIDLGRSIALQPSTALFVTMNPSYIGRNQLPDNMKNLFRSFAMTYPDKGKILEVMLYSQGFKHAATLAGQIVGYFDALSQQCTRQKHYDWGLRALKSVLRACGSLRRSMQASSLNDELQIVCLAHVQTIVPKLTEQDLAVFVSVVPAPPLKHAPLPVDLGPLDNPRWTAKLYQLHHFLELHHGVMLVGPTSGKTSCWRTLAKVHDAEVHQIDPKTSTKELLYGKLDVTTREWTDGLFTAILRRISATRSKRNHWIVFDGEIDPDWAENLNSVLDDNKLLTLPSGERIPLPSNVRILFEVASLDAATPATVSRCGMVWFDALDPAAVIELQLQTFENRFEEPLPQVEKVLDAVRAVDLAALCDKALTIDHIMPFSYHRALSTFFSLIEAQPSPETVKQAAVWAFAGDANFADFAEFAEWLNADMTVDANGDLWRDTAMDLEPQDVVSSSLIVPTRDTARLESLMQSLLVSHTPTILCGPPGAGKTMILLSSLRSSQMALVCLNFSKTTQPDAIIKALEEKCIYKQSGTGLVLEPARLGQWAILFCDEINLPTQDKYGSQKVICLLRQLVERGGFYKGSKWVTLKRVQIVGACNPPTDVGRLPLDERFLRHCAVVFVDHPRGEALQHIYKTICAGLLKCVPDLRGSHDVLADAMISVYEQSANRFVHKQPHYIYSPRELTRWVKGIYMAIKDRHMLDWDGLVRVWLHEGWRLFGDRLVLHEEREWTWTLMTSSAPPCGQTALESPVLFSDWLNKEYCSVNRTSLVEFLKARLRVFNEEVAEKPLTLFDEMVDHILRINRVLRQPQGHMILIGISACGKTTMTKFVCWMNGISMFQLQTSRGYTEDMFLADLRTVLRQAGCEGRKTCLLLDESNLLDSSFIEKMNTLLANSEIPGLFQTEELLEECRRSSALHGLNLVDEDDLMQWFNQQVTQNLHVVFTMSSGSQKIKASSSPALFNRCVVDWVGDWSKSALAQVARDHIKNQRAVPIAVDFHLIVKELFAATPGDFLAFMEIHHKLSGERQSALESQQRHFNVGVEKLKGTMLEVKQLRQQLDAKGAQLKVKDSESRKMLQQILNEQNEAERRREAGFNIRATVEAQNIEIEQHKKRVYENLALTEPAVLEAKRGVSNIKKQHLNELRAFNNPPEAVKQTLEAVCYLLGLKHSTWREVLQAVRGEEFIPSIVNFNGEDMSESVISQLEKGYLATSSYEQVDRASKACGPLQQWVAAQVVYATTLKDIEPLQQQVESLELAAAEKQAQENAINEMLQELEASIESYKNEYSELIAETQAIKSEISMVQEKLATSIDLVAGLEEEKKRWMASISNFAQRQERLTGSCVLEAAYLTYAGRLDQAQRAALVDRWKEALAIPFDEPSLSTASQRLEWGVYSDTLSLENSAMIAQHQRTPFIIDPSSKVLQLLKGIPTTSLLDGTYRKHVESAMRFGSSLVVCNAEHFDAALMPLLNQDYIRHGGRSTLRIFGRDIDVNRGFKIYLLTEDAHVAIMPHVSARCTVINFTITRNSLEHIVLERVLAATTPALEAERRNLSTLQGEYEVQLHKLEIDLLGILNTAQGNILDSLDVIKSLESVKLKAAEIAQKAVTATEAMARVEKASAEFLPIAEMCGRVYGVVERLEKIQPCYQFGLHTFLALFEEVLAKFESIETFMPRFVQHVYAELSVSLLEEDRAAFASVLSCEEHATNTDWAQIIAKSSKCVFAVRDWDPTLQLQALRSLKTVALGSREGEALAMQALEAAQKLGGCVLVQNLDMAPTWMEKLAAKLRQPAHPDFKALFTMQFGSDVSPAVLSLCRLIAVERPRGVKNGLTQNLLKLDTQAPPAERARIMLCLAWLHALLQERQRLYGGWNGPYDFNDFDLRYAAQIVQDKLAAFGARANVDPEALPWQRMKELLFTSVYGAKVDDSADRAVIAAMLEHSFSPEIYELGYQQSANCADTTTPEFLEELPQWTASLKQRPQWLGLEDDAESAHLGAVQQQHESKMQLLV